MATTLGLCVVLLTACAGTVSSDKSRGKTVQQLGDDPPCGTPVECYAQAIEALKEAEQKIEGLNNAILTLNQTLKQVVTNQSQVNEQLKANQTQLNTSIEKVKGNQMQLTKTIETVKATTSANSKAVSVNSHKLSTLTTYTCNCSKPISTLCPANQVSRASFDNRNWCCDICVTTAKEPAEYMQTHPLPHPLQPEKATKSKKTL